jgi:hypothetical protein
VLPPPSSARAPAETVKVRHPSWWGQNGGVKLRIGTAVAFGLGYTLGSRAGRQRYQQIVRVAESIRHSGPVTGTLGVAGDRARALGSLGVVRLRDAVGVRLGWRDGDEAADAIAAGMARDVASALNGQRTSAFRPND